MKTFEGYKEAHDQIRAFTHPEIGEYEGGIHSFAECARLLSDIGYGKLTLFMAAKRLSQEREENLC